MLTAIPGTSQITAWQIWYSSQQLEDDMLYRQSDPTCWSRKRHYTQVTEQANHLNQMHRTSYAGTEAELGTLTAQDVDPVAEETEIGSRGKLRSGKQVGFRKNRKDHRSVKEKNWSLTVKQSKTGLREHWSRPGAQRRNYNPETEKEEEVNVAVRRTTRVQKKASQGGAKQNKGETKGNWGWKLGACTVCIRETFQLPFRVKNTCRTF